MTQLPYRTGLVGTGGATTGRLVIDATTLITLAKADPSGAQLDILTRTGRQVIITSTVLDEATASGAPTTERKTIEDWVARKGNSNELRVELSTYPAGSQNGERSIVDYVAANPGNVRVLTDDLNWNYGDRISIA